MNQIGSYIFWLYSDYWIAFMSPLKKTVPVGVLFTLFMQINNEHSSKLDIVFCDCDSCIFVALMCLL